MGYSTQNLKNAQMITIYSCFNVNGAKKFFGLIFTINTVIKLLFFSNVYVNFGNSILALYSIFKHTPN